MGKSINKVILVGRLGRDPELKYTASGTPFCRFSMATDAAPPRVSNSPRAALRYPDFRYFQGARFLAVVATEMLEVAVGWQVFQITHRPLDLGYVGLVQFLPGVLLSVPAGHTADRFDRRILLAVPSGHNVSNLLRSGFLPTLLDRGVKVVIASPFAVDASFVNEFAGERVELVTLPPWTPTAAERVVESALSERFLRDTNLRAVRLQRDRARLLDPWRGRRADQEGRRRTVPRATSSNVRLRPRAPGRRSWPPAGL